MRTFYADDILHWDERQIWARVDDLDPITLIFSDGEIIADFPQTLISWYFWEYHRQYPGVPLCIKNHVYGEPLSKGLENKLHQRAVDQVLAEYPREDIQNLYKINAGITQRLHNAIATDGEEFQATLDALDFLEIHRHPKLKEIRERPITSKRDIANGYKESVYILSHDPSLNRNNLAIPHRGGFTKTGQMLQVIVKVGFRSEINQRIFFNPIPVGFSEHLKRLSFSAMDRCSAAQAQLATSEPVKRTEYYNRELQLITYVVHGVDQNDCGSKETIPWKVTKDDLEHVLPGKYYFDRDGELKMVRGKGYDNHLVGTVIRMRTPSKCQHPDDGVVCKYCLCENASRVQADTNPGFALTVTQNEAVSQDVISTKHHLVSAESESYVIHDHELKYISNLGDDKEITLSRDLWGKHVKVRFDVSDIFRLADIPIFNELKEGDLSRISTIKEMVLIIDNGDKNPKMDIVPVSRGSYRPFLTKEFIQYMRDFSFQTVGKYIEVDLMNWDNAETILRFPERRGSTLEQMEELKSVIFMSSDIGKELLRRDLTDPVNLAGAIRLVCDMTNRKFSVNLGIVELVLYCMMGRDPKNGDYRLPKLGTGIHFAPQTRIMSGRSLSAKAAYERQFEMIADPKSYIHRIRPNHTFDPLFLNIKKWNQYWEQRGVKTV